MKDDIVAVMYVYLPDIGYIAELQLGHPFCFYVFRIDSKLRDIRNGDQYTIDLWDHDFYNTIKAEIYKDNNYNWKNTVINHYKSLNAIMHAFNS